MCNVPIFLSFEASRLNLYKDQDDGKIAFIPKKKLFKFENKLKDSLESHEENRK